jgi:hypothetical protein
VTRQDRAVALTLALVALGGVVYEPLERLVQRALSPEALAQTRWGDAVHGGRSLNTSQNDVWDNPLTPAFWVTQDGRSISFFAADAELGLPAEPGVGRPTRLPDVVLRSQPSVPPDPWGNPWVLRLRWKGTLHGGFVRDVPEVLSAGPDGRFDEGRGDDVLVGRPGAGLPERHGRRGRALIALAAIGAWLYVAARQWQQPPSPNVWVELARAALVGVCLLPVYAILGDLARGADLGVSALLVPKDTAVMLTATAVTVGGLFFVRLRRARDQR